MAGELVPFEQDHGAAFESHGESFASVSATARIAATSHCRSRALRKFAEKDARLRETLNNEAVRGEAAEILSTLIESVTIYPDGEHGPEGEIVAVADLLGFATNDNTAPRGGVDRSMALVAGTGFGHKYIDHGQSVISVGQQPDPSPAWRCRYH